MPGATFRLPRGYLEATLRPSGSQPVGTPEPPSGYPGATLRLPSGYPQATLKPPQSQGTSGEEGDAQDGTLVQESPVPRLEPGAWDTSAVWREGLSFVFGWRIWLNAPK
jgi:hypothetical protein